MLASVNTEPILLVWMVIAISGIIFAAINTNLANRSVKFLDRHSIKNGKRKIANKARVEEIIRLVIQLIETLLGGIAMSIPTSHFDLPFWIHVKGLTVQYGLVACAMLTLVQSINSFRLRRYFLADHEGEIERGDING